MPAITESNLLQALGWAVINSLWQFALLWVIFQVARRIFKLHSYQKVRLGTGMVILGMFFFLLTFSKAYFYNSTINPAEYFVLNLLSKEAVMSWSEKIMFYASITYILLLFVPVFQFARNYRYVSVIRTTGLAKIDAEWRLFVRNTSEIMGIKSNVQVWLSHLVDSPVTVGFLKPVILIPFAAISNLSTKQVEAILLHELSHVRRFDYLMNLVVNLIRTVLYFNPFVGAFVKMIESEREKSCDELVMQFEYNPQEYASALLKLEREGHAQGYRMLLAATGNNSLLTRVERILGINKKDKYSVRRFVGAIAVMVCLVCMNAFLFLGKEKNTEPFFGFTNTYNPYLFMGGYDDPKPAALKEIETMAITETPAETFAMIAEETEQLDEALIPDRTHPSNFYHVNFITSAAPELEAKELAKVKGTIEATKKILADQEWKALQSSYADALNSCEKKQLKKIYLDELNKVDWKSLENKLKLTYDQIDWHEVDAQVNVSMAQIRMDSIRYSMNIALEELETLEEWMDENNTTSIPDSDITLEAVKNNQKIARQHLERLKAVKQKKIVRL